MHLQCLELIHVRMSQNIPLKMVHVSSLQTCVYKMWCSMKSYSVHYCFTCFKQHRNLVLCIFVCIGYFMSHSPIWDIGFLLFKCKTKLENNVAWSSARNVAGQITRATNVVQDRCFLVIGQILAGDPVFKLRCLLLLCTYNVYDHMHLGTGVSSMKVYSVNYIIRQAHPK